MCGIFAFLANSPMERGMIRGMSEILRHRGPDDEGFVAFSPKSAQAFGGRDTPASAYTTDVPYRPRHDLDEWDPRDAFLMLGFRRLSIQDLSPLGHQPMSYRDRYWIVYNGEVYNFLELREELAGLGYTFHSQGDTEVILAAYDRWGERCLERFNGMWAFAIYDTERDRLFIARDRFGVKPLYYWVTPDGSLALSSEIKAFTKIPGWKARMNGQRVHDYLAWGLQDHTDETMFAGVFQIPPGHSAVVDGAREGRQVSSKAGRISVERWYEIHAAPFEGDYEEAAVRLRDTLRDSVRLRLRADVEVGSCLSGGLDSSAIVCLANGLLREQGAAQIQNTFSACSEVARYDERTYIEDVVAHTGVRSHYVYPHASGLFQHLPSLVWHQDEPFGSTSIYAQWCVFGLAARAGIRVMLDGQGSDEQLAGYHNFLGVRLAGLFRSLQILRLASEWKAIRSVHGYSHVKLLMRLGGNLVPGIIRPMSAILGRESASVDWLDLERLGATAGDPVSGFGARATNLRDASISQLAATNLPMLLHWEDRDSMAHSIEARVPFLDYRLVELVLGLPDEFKLDAGITKRVLRDAMQKVIPERIRSRTDKLGFVTPEEVWATGELRAAFRDGVERAIAASQGILKSETLATCEEIFAGQRAFSSFPWRVICFGEWLRTFSVEAPQ